MFSHPPIHILTETAQEALDSVNDMGLVVQQKAEERGSDGLFEMKGV